MAYSGITAAEVLADEALKQELFQKIKDNFDELYSTVYGLTVEVKNGSFELDSDADNVPDNWEFTAYTGGIGGIDTTAPCHGKQSFAITHPGGSGNGGGELQPAVYYPISEQEIKVLSFAIKATGANLHNIVQVRYFGTAYQYLDYETLYNETSSPTSWTEYSYRLTPTTGARFFKVKLIGGYTDYTTAGTTSFDHIRHEPPAKSVHIKLTSGTFYLGIGDHSVLPGGTMGFMPVMELIRPDSTTIAFYVSGESAITQYYPTASGREYWPFLIARKDGSDMGQGVKYHVWFAPDHPCVNNSGSEIITPHPWPGYAKNGPPEGCEIVLLDLATYEHLEEIRKEKGYNLWYDAFAWAIENGYKLDLETEIPWVPRDMDGRRVLSEQGPYTHRRLIKEEN